MTPCELTVAITAVANAIACRVTNNDTLNVLALSLSQLGDTLSTIAAQRQCLCAGKKDQSSSDNKKDQNASAGKKGQEDADSGKSDGEKRQTRTQSTLRAYGNHGLE